MATCLSNCISCAYFFHVVHRYKKTSALSTLLFDLDYVVIDRLMAAYGDIPLAAIGIVLKAERLPLNVGIGLCQGMMPLVAYNYASKNHGRMEETVRVSRRVGLATAFGEGGKALFLGVMRWAVFNIPMLFVLNRVLGMYGIVWSQIAADILTVALSVYVYRRHKASREWS